MMLPQHQLPPPLPPQQGIGFCWGIAKNHYRARNLSDKKRKANWMKLVRECTDNKKVITLECVRLFGRRIRRYMLAYLAIDNVQNNNHQESTHLQHSTEDPHLKIPEMSLQLVERLVKVHKSPRKSHRNILDSEMKFLRCVARWMKKRSGNGDGTEEEVMAEVDFED